MPENRRRRQRLAGFLSRLRSRWQGYLDDRRSQGRLQAHQLAAYSRSPHLERVLERAHRQRGHLPALLSAGRRAHLNGLIGSLERELEARRQKRRERDE